MGRLTLSAVAGSSAFLLLLRVVDAVGTGIFVGKWEEQCRAGSHSISRMVQTWEGELHIR
jgi:hypothetical protein